MSSSLNSSAIRSFLSIALLVNGSGFFRLRGGIFQLASSIDNQAV
jgi:hypothetical protein